MRRKINTERIERLAMDTGVLSKVVDHLMEELVQAPPSSHQKVVNHSIDNRIAHFFEREND